MKKKSNDEKKRLPRKGKTCHYLVTFSHHLALFFHQKCLLVCFDGKKEQMMAKKAQMKKHVIAIICFFHHLA